LATRPVEAQHEQQHRRGVAIANGFVSRDDIHVEQVGRAGGGTAVRPGRRELIRSCHAGARRSRGTGQQQVADRIDVAIGRATQIEWGKVSGHNVITRNATAID
jgi:hypothetical protein